MGVVEIASMPIQELIYFNNTFKVNKYVTVFTKLRN